MCEYIRVQFNVSTPRYSRNYRCRFVCVCIIYHVDIWICPQSTHTHIYTQTQTTYRKDFKAENVQQRHRADPPSPLRPLAVVVVSVVVVRGGGGGGAAAAGAPVCVCVCIYIHVCLCIYSAREPNPTHTSHNPQQIHVYVIYTHKYTQNKPMRSYRFTRWTSQRNRRA